MLDRGSALRRAIAVVVPATLCVAAASAHHSLAMFDLKQTYVMTGVVMRVDPNPNHLQIFVAPLNVARDQVLKDGKNEPVAWAIEFEAAGVAARGGITVTNFPRGTIVSVGLHPLRTGLPAGARSKSPLFKCPADTPPAPGKHCDAVKGSIAYGEGRLPSPTGPMPVPRTR
jgi:hypothetical protein